MVKSRVDAGLIALDRQLDQLKRRAGRLRRRVEQGTAQRTAGSSTMDESLRLVDQIAGTAPLGLAGISVKISVLRWFLEATDAILDAKCLR